MKRVHLVISGDVQGVGFRAWVLRLAEGMSMSGWVTNRKDRTVEIVAEGPKGELENLVKACQHGPEISWVEKVDVTWSEATGEFANFQVVY